MISRRAFWFPFAGILFEKTDNANLNQSLGTDHRQWMRRCPGEWRFTPVELEEVKPGDVILQFDVVNGDMVAPQLFQVAYRDGNKVILDGPEQQIYWMDETEAVS